MTPHPGFDNRSDTLLHVLIAEGIVVLAILTSIVVIVARAWP